MTVNSCCRFLILFLLILTNGSVYVNIFSGGFVYGTILIVAAFSILMNPKINLAYFKSLLFSLAACIGLLFISWVLNNFNMTAFVYPKYIFRFVCVALAFFALVTNGKDGFSLKELLLPLKVITIHALINFIVGFVFGDLRVAVPSENLIIQTIGYVFFYISFYEAGSVLILRNNGIFWEPGVLAVLMNLFLFLQVYFQPKSHHSVKAVTIIVIISTFSTTGLGVMCLIFAFQFFANKISVKRLTTFIIVASIMTPVMIVNIQEKVSGESKVSFLSRNYDALIALDIIKNNLLTGIGPALETYLAEQQKYPIFMLSVELDGARGNTNSIFSALISFGLPIGGLFLTMFYFQNLVRDRKKLFFISLILLASEPLLFTGIFMLFMISTFYSRDALVGNFLSKGPMTDEGR